MGDLHQLFSGITKSCASFAQLFPLVRVILRRARRAEGSTITRSSELPLSASRTLSRTLFFLAGAFLLTACTRSLLPASGGYFIAPTLVGAANPIILETFTPLPPTERAPCDNNLVFIRDVTVPDGTRFAPGAPIEKSWELRNDGTCAWIRGYSVQLKDGPAMGAIDRQALPEAQPGETIVLTIEFTAPPAAGNYRSLWKAHDLDGKEFGVGFYIDIIVD